MVRAIRFWVVAAGLDAILESSSAPTSWPRYSDALMAGSNARMFRSIHALVASVVLVACGPNQAGRAGDHSTVGQCRGANCQVVVETAGRSSFADCFRRLHSDACASLRVDVIARCDLEGLSLGDRSTRTFGPDDVPPPPGSPSRCGSNDPRLRDCCHESLIYKEMIGLSEFHARCSRGEVVADVVVEPTQSMAMAKRQCDDLEARRDYLEGTAASLRRRRGQD